MVIRQIVLCCLLNLAGFSHQIQARAPPGVTSRREIRTLSEAERTAFFAAMNVMKTASLVEGLEKYGPNFRTLDYLVRKHAAAVMDEECDQAHIYAAFWPFHAALNREYERSLMAIDEYNMDKTE